MTPEDCRKALETFKALKVFPRDTWIQITMPQYTALGSPITEGTWLRLAEEADPGNQPPKGEDVVFVHFNGAVLWVKYMCISDWSPDDPRG